MMSSSSSSLSSASFLPSLSQADVEQAAQLIQRTYAPIGLSPEDQKRLQQEIFDIQKRPEAWGLVVPFLNHQDSNVQFFGAHTAQVKIARDWASFPHEHDEDLRDTMIEITSRAIMASRNKVILRKLFVALTSLALLLVPGHPSRWPGWIVSCVTAFSNSGASVEHILDFLAIVAEEIDTAVLFGPSKLQLQQSLLDATPMVIQAITSTITDPQIPLRNLLSALKCLEAWLTTLPSSDLTPLIAVLINLLISYNSDDAFVAISDTLQEIMSKSALSNGAGSRTLTEPLLVYLHVVASPRFDASLGAGAVDESLHSLCKLLVAMGDHSTSYIAANLASSTPVLIPQNLFPWALSGQVATRGQLTQNFLRMMLSFTALPGWYGVDEDESEMTLSFWYLFQEALWSTDFEEGDATPGGAQEAEVVAVSKVVYSQLVQILRRKTVWPSSLQGWTRDQVDKFQVYRRDVGDSLVNAYYILRDDMLKYYLDEVEACLNKQQANGGDGWEDAEAILHCIISIEESLDLEKTPQLSRLFSPSILGRIPVSGHHRIRRTTLSLISTYASWFPSQSTSHPASTLSTMLLGVVHECAEGGV
ncbi:hypothetical protein ONZ45_g13157 [Pleurotus djamor]|nr:hypothetical protein ONZ45_g13157 [Pleurotus djamor]